MRQETEKQKRRKGKKEKTIAALYHILWMAQSMKLSFDTLPPLLLFLRVKWLIGGWLIRSPFESSQMVTMSSVMLLLLPLSLF